MKKFIVLALATISICVSAAEVSAQSTSPRYSATGGNTGAQLNYNWIAKTDATGADTLKVTPNAYCTSIRASLTDSLGISIASTTKSYAGDQMQIIASGASGTKVKFIGTNFQTAGTATLSSGLNAVITLVFSGTKWVEKSRVVQ